MAGERIVSQANGIPLGVVEALEIGGAYFAGDVTGSTPSLPNIRTSIKTPEGDNPLFLQNTPVIVRASRENIYGTVKSVDWGVGHNTSGLDIEPITSKLSQDVVTYPSWGQFAPTVSGQISSVLNSCGITYWPIPGQLHHAFELGGSNRKGLISSEVYTSSKFRDTESWVANDLLKESPSPLLLNNLTQILVTAQTDSLVVGAKATFNFVRSVGDPGEETTSASVISGSAVVLEIEYLGKIVTGTVSTHTFRLFDKGAGTKINVSFNSDSAGGSNNVLRVNVAVRQIGKMRTATVSGGAYSTTYEQQQSKQSTIYSYSTVDDSNVSGAYKLQSFSRIGTLYAYVYNLTDNSFDVGSAPRLYPYDIRFGSVSSERIGIPGSTGSGWSVLSDMLSAYGFVFDVVGGTFIHKSAWRESEKSPREIGYLSSPMSISSTARETAARCNITLYDYTVPMGTTPIRLWTSDTTYTIGVGEVQEVSVDLEDGTSLTSIVAPKRLDAAVLADYINKGTGGHISGYSVWTTDNREVMGTAWDNSGASVKARVGESSNQIILTFTGPKTRIYPGNDETDNGNYSIAPYAGAEKNGLVLAGLGIKSNKRVVTTLTGAPAQTSREAPIEYNNKFVSSLAVLWDVASDLAYAYGREEIRATGSFTNPYDSEPFAAKPPARSMRIGGIPVTINNYSRQAGGALFSDAEVGTTVNAVDDYFVDRTCAQVYAEKQNYSLKQDTIQPYGKALV